MAFELVYDLPSAKYPTHRSVVMGTNGLVATAHPTASQVGIDVLKQGGNAMDAALATAWALNVLQPMMCGMGGDVFLLYYNAKEKRTYALNGAGIAPYKATREFFVSQGYQKMPLRGMQAVAVPGAVHAYYTALERFGTMDMADLMQPAIRYAEKGFPVPHHTAGYIEGTKEVLKQYPSSAAIYLPKGRAPRPGEILVQKDMAHSMRLIAKGGPDVLYRGVLAQKIEDYSLANGGLLTKAELSTQTTDIYEPLSTTYRGLEVLQTAPPSQGFIMLELLNLMEGFDLVKMGHNSAETIHAMVEMKKLAFADRNTYAGDPTMIDWPLDTLISKEYASRRRKRFNPDRASNEVLGEEQLGDTTYFCVIDGEGNAVSFIQSLSLAFGCGEVVEGTGIALNDRAGRGFSLEKGHPNCIAPGKKTMHTLNCFMVLDKGKPLLVGGTPGGDGQPQWGAQVLANIIDYGMNVQQAIEAPRWLSFPGSDPVNVDKPFTLIYEDRILKSVIDALGAKGHHMIKRAAFGGGGGVQLIMIHPQNGVFFGGSDPREDGSAIAY